MTLTCGIPMTVLLVNGVVPAPRWAPIVASFTYDEADPYAVTARFDNHGDPVSWVFARALLTAGLNDQAGAGDVQVWPGATGNGLIYISLCSPHGRALIQADAAGVRAFLNRTYRSVPHGMEWEHLDLEALVAALLAGPAP